MCITPSCPEDAEAMNATRYASPGATAGYVPDLDKDISFLKEMQKNFNKANGGSHGCFVAMEHLGIMIRDWLHELEATKRA